MILSRRTVLTGSLALPFLGRAARAAPEGKGDGRMLDHHAIKLAVADAVRAADGIVVLPAGRYLCFSIRLRLLSVRAA